jgi:DNA-binding CsgD family transcriptional regulator
MKHADAIVADLAAVAASSASLDEFRHETFGALERLVGFDYGIVWRTDGPRSDGATVVGFPARYFELYAANEHRFGSELEPVFRAAIAKGVAADTDVLPIAKRDRLSFYAEIIRPVGSRTYLTGVLSVRGSPIGMIQLGRASASFTPKSIARLERLLPVLTLGESVRIPSDRAPRFDRSRLTEREREIVDYLALGFTNAEIARGCGTSVHTIRNQLHKLYAKLDVSTRAELVGLLRQ